MIVVQPVLEIYAAADFALWPVAEFKSHGFLPLSGDLSLAEIGTAVRRIAECNDIDPEHDGRPPRPADPLGAFLHGLLTMNALFAPGGLRVADSATGIMLLPGCCEGLEDWRGWLSVANGTGHASFGHDPSPFIERHGDTARLTVDAEQDDSPVIELPVTELLRLLADAESSMADFLEVAVDWATQYTPNHVASVTVALARALDLPAPAVMSKP